MAGKKPTSKKSDDRPVTRTELKTEMVNYIGPIFEDLTHRIDSKTHRLEVLMEDMQTKIMNALEAYSSVSVKEEVVNKHEKRITRLETDMTAVKTTLKTENTKF